MVHRCPVCRNNCSVQAAVCPKCGHPFVVQGYPLPATQNTKPKKRWNGLVAMLLSLLIPGVGQIYKGQVLSGILWFVIVAIGYAMFIFPGLFLHFFCILGAGLGDPYK